LKISQPWFGMLLPGRRARPRERACAIMRLPYPSVEIAGNEGTDAGPAE
jgi:hypothetical protein